MREKIDSEETVETDLWGEIVRAYWHGEPAAYTLRRDDGQAAEMPSPAVYFEEKLSPCEQKALQHVRGRVLDLGCGPGRILLYLQGRGFAATGIDVSPLTVEVARQRGCRDVRIMSLTDLNFPSNSFDTVLSLGNNLGLAGSLDASHALFRNLYEITSPQGLIIGHTIDPTKTDAEQHRRYHRWNQQRGRYLGRITIRKEFHGKVSPWWDLMLFEKPVLDTLLQQNGWRVSHCIDGEGGSYWVVARKHSYV